MCDIIDTVNGFILGLIDSDVESKNLTKVKIFRLTYDDGNGPIFIYVRFSSFPL